MVAIPMNIDALTNRETVGMAKNAMPPEELNDVVLKELVKLDIIRCNVISSICQNFLDNNSQDFLKCGNQGSFILFFFNKSITLIIKQSSRCKEHHFGSSQKQKSICIMNAIMPL
jgi:hypothetical protein